MPEVVETDVDRAAALTERRARVHAQARDGRLFDGRRGAGRKHRQALLGGRQCAGQELAFRSVQLQREYELRPALPPVVGQQCHTSDEIGERRGVGRRRFGAFARNQVQLGQLLALVLRCDQATAAVELIDDLEDRLLPLLGGVCAASSLPIRRCASARDASGIRE